MNIWWRSYWGFVVIGILAIAVVSLSTLYLANPRVKVIEDTVKITSLQQEIGNVKAQLDISQGSLKDAQTANQRLQNQISGLNQNISSLNDLKVNLETQLNNSVPITVRDQLQSQINSLNSQVNNLQAELAARPKIPVIAQPTNTLSINREALLSLMRMVFPLAAPRDPGTALYIYQLPTFSDVQGFLANCRTKSTTFSVGTSYVASLLGDFKAAGGVWEHVPVGIARTGLTFYPIIALNLNGQPVIYRFDPALNLVRIYGDPSVGFAAMVN